MGISHLNFGVMLQYLFYAFLIFMAYRLVFHLIIPIYKTTKQVNKQLREMHNRMEDHINQQQANQQNAGTRSETKKEQVGGDYIDFEEVK